ncbi:Copper chaperone for superoxide dismutase [Plakobranchus ocellatus]|uniref:Superoxide dismutase copper chaperone n=1 Tax=Plakobranchus ocellatus TaxID=259542 RepID=A0AAV4AM87_9GAST|nr:Copper chaperone for superoxide dismutase [Plakobranchus ocellatus]
MSAEKENSTTKMEFAVEMRSPCCAPKVEKALNNVPGIKSVKVEAASQKLIVEGSVSAETVRSEVENKTGMSTVLLGHGSSSANLGAGVAAISIGSTEVQGLLRFVQSDQNTCVVEGTVDWLPTTEPVYLSIHETGDVSNGCQSCGPLLSDGDKFTGILGELHPSQERRAEFRLTTNAVRLPDIYGHCVVIHKGTERDVKQNKSERLACGIIARSSGLFENSKRFCACDGVTIWEQRKMDQEAALS